MRQLGILSLALLSTGCPKKATDAEQAAIDAVLAASPLGEALGTSTPTAGTLSANPLLHAVDHPDRPADDVARDADRRPLQVMTFAGIEEGMFVADLMAGRGYYTELFARAVGPTGLVYAHNNAFVLDRFAQAPLDARLDRLGMPHVVPLRQELDALSLPVDGLDVAFMGLFYHDAVWMEADRAAMNAAIFDALRPGGIYLVTDHAAADGSGLEEVETLHRIERHIVVDEVLAAGFVLDGESDALRHPEDDRTLNVFDDAIRGKTDRFVLRFTKPEPG